MVRATLEQVNNMSWVQLPNMPYNMNRGQWCYAWRLISWTGKTAAISVLMTLQQGRCVYTVL